jgi:P-type Ca2+ transporter type 2C
VHNNGTVPSPEQAEHLRFLALAQAGTTTASLYEESGLWKVAGDPTEGAMLAAGRKLGLNAQDQNKSDKLFSFPFDSERKRASAIRKWKDNLLRVEVNGAPDVLLELCTHLYVSTGLRPLDKAEKESIIKANLIMAGKGLRVLGSAYRDFKTPAGSIPKMEEVEKDLVFLGLTGMYDPPRPEAKQAVAICHDAGIRVVMITGDHPSTALAIAKELGIVEGEGIALTGAQLDGMDEAVLKEKVTQVSIFARVTAAHKLRVVQAWRSQGAIVAMTGDGVNDAPALKGADIGIAMGRSGTEVTKQASDMIIADDNFATIVAAVEEGRGIYQNIRNTLQFLLAGNAGEILLMTVAIVAGLPLPLLPIHLLWINLVTDGLPALCLASERIDPDVMKRKPLVQKEILSDKPFLATLFLTGFLSAGVSLVAFIWGLKTYGPEVARSLAFGTLVLEELLRSLGARSETKPFWSIDPRGNPRLFVVVGCSILLQVLLHQNTTLGNFLKIVPLSVSQWATIFCLAMVPLLVLGVIKVFRSRHLKLAQDG